MAENTIFPPDISSTSAGNATYTQNSQQVEMPACDSGYIIAAGGFSLLIGEREMACFSNVLRQAYLDYTLNAPRPGILPLLMRINVLSALASNAKHLGIASGGLCQSDLISPFNILGPLPLNDPQPLSPLWPTTLQPTALQRTIVHHPWIDLLPFATLRDNMLKLLAFGLLDDDEFCFDILELSDNDISTRPALIVWGEAFNWSSWEVNDAFLRKWGYLLRGCPQIIASTNYWRTTRGEKPVTYRL